MRRVMSLPLIVGLLFLAGCTGHEPLRTAVGEERPCAVTGNPPQLSACANQVWERVQTDSQSEYDMFYVEFDDMGLGHPRTDDPKNQAWDQIEQVTQKLQMLGKQSGISLVVYVHGWKHNAAHDDGNVGEFHEILKSVSLVEQARDAADRRRVVGVYVGWRGLSATVEPLLEASFWARKSAALHVAQGSSRHFRARLRAFQRTQNCAYDPQLCDGKAAQTVADAARQKSAAQSARVRMILIGHSFGGLVVYNAISEYLVESLTESGQGSTEASRGAPVPQRFGDMVVLLNPAFEAIRYTPLQRVASRRPYDQYQAPILVAITSTADWATRYAFPLGRHMNSIFEHAASPEEAAANSNTMGHVDAYITHELVKEDGEDKTCPDWNPQPASVADMKADADLERKAASAFFKDARNARELTPKGERVVLKDGWTRRFCGNVVLRHKPRQSKTDSPYDRNNPNSPIWNVRTDKSLVTGHNDIRGPFLANFIRQLYHDSAVATLR